MLYSAMYCPARRSARATSSCTSAGMRLEKRSASRASAHWRRVQSGPLGQALLEGGEGEVEQHHEGQLVVEEVVGDVGRGLVAGEDLVEGQDRARGRDRTASGRRGVISFMWPSSFSRSRSKRANIGVEGLLVAGEVAAHEGLERLAVAVRRRARSSPPARSPRRARSRWPSPCASTRADSRASRASGAHAGSPVADSPAAADAASEADQHSRQKNGRTLPHGASSAHTITRRGARRA